MALSVNYDNLRRQGEYSVWELGCENAESAVGSLVWKCDGTKKLESLVRCAVALDAPWREAKSKP